MRRWTGILIGVVLLAAALWFADSGLSVETAPRGSLSRAPVPEAEQATPRSGGEPMPPGDSVEEVRNFFSGGGVPVEGTVVDGAGQPVGGVSLFLFRPSEEEDDGKETLSATESRDDGTFRMRAPGPGDYSAKLTHDDYLEAELPVMAPAQDVRWVLSSGASVEAEVVDEAGQPVPEAQVHVLPEPMSRAYRSRTGLTDEAGKATVLGIAPGRYRVVAAMLEGQPLRAARQEVELRGSERVRVRLRFDEGRTLFGLVVDMRGRPVEDAELRVVPAALVDSIDTEHPELIPYAEQWEDGWFAGATPRQRTGPDGRFTLRHLNPGDYVVTALKDGYAFDSKVTGGKRRTLGPYTGVLVPAGASEVRLVLAPLGSVRGRVVRADGSPVTRFQINERYQEDAQGAFRWPVPVSGEEVLAFVASGLAGAVRKVQVQRGLDVDLGDVVLEAGREVRVRVVAAGTSEPVAGASVDLLGAGEESTERSLLWRITEERHTSEGSTVYIAPEAFRTGADGTLVLPHVQEGPATLWVSHSDYLEASAPLGAKQREVTVELRPGAWVHGEVRAGKRLIQHGMVKLHTSQGQYAQVGRIQGGLYTVGPLEAGSYILQAEPFIPDAEEPPVFLPSRVEVPAGGTVTLDLEARSSGAVVEVRVPEKVARLLLVPGAHPLPCPRESLSRALGLGHEGRLDAEGRFRFRHLPAGRYTLLLMRDLHEEELEMHREELEVPGQGTASFEVQPRWERCGSPPSEQ